MAASKKYDDDMVAKTTSLARNNTTNSEPLEKRLARATKMGLRCAAGRRLRDAEERCADELYAIFYHAVGADGHAYFNDEQMETMRSILAMRREAREDVENMDKSLYE
jgi:hypothetical protein